MTLPTSGQLTFSQIGTELGISTTGPHDLRSMSSTASKTAPDNITDFYGYSHGPPAPSSHSINEGPILINGSFTDNSTNETGFRVEYDINNGGYTFSENLSANDNNYTLTPSSIGLDANEDLTVRVRSYNGSGTSLWVYSNTLTYEGGK